MRTIFILIISISSLLSASPFFVLGTSNNQISNIQKYKNSIVWSKKNGKYRASKPLDDVNITDDNVFILVNNNTLSFREEVVSKSYFIIKKGWNKLSTPKNGIDIIKTFRENKAIKFVYVYDKLSNAWAGFSSEKYIVDEMKKTRILSLTYIEEGKEFYIYSTEKAKIKIVTTKLNTPCQKLFDSSKYNILTDSGILRDKSRSKVDSIALKSRYFSHYKRGIYNDTRVMLFYPKLKDISKKELKYGPASPTISISYSESYAEKKFYIFDYLKKNCYQGVFPSKNIPPFSSLNKLKEKE